MPGLSGEIANLIVALKLDDSGFSGKLNGVAGQLKAMDSGLSQVGRGVGQVGTGFIRLAERAALAGAAGVTAAVTTAASYESAFTGVEKTVEATDAQFRELEDTLKRMAGATGTAFEELAAIGETGGALGIDVNDLDEFIDVVNRLAVSTPLSAEAASTALGQLGNILGFTGEEFEDFADALVALGNAGASTEDQIIDIAARFGAAARSAGLSNEAILALSSTVASMGIEAEAGGSSLSRLFNNLVLDIGTSSKEAEELADALGLSMAGLRSAWERDAEAVFSDLLEYISKLDQFEAAQFLADLGITNTRDVNAIRNLSLGVEEYADQLAVAESASGSLREESDKFYATTEANWGKVVETIRNNVATIGDQLLPVVNEQLEDFVAWLNTPGTQAGIADFARDLADGLGSLIDELRGTDWSGVIGGLKLAAEVAKGAFDAFRALPEPIQQLAIAALVANKVSGGAIGMIAKGLGNILLGSLKTIMAGNVTVIGTNVIGGGPGGGGGRGGGRIPGLPLGVGAAAGIVGLSLLQTGSENVTAEMSNTRIRLEREVNEGLKSMTEAAEEWTQRYGAGGINPFGGSSPQITATVDASSFDTALRENFGGPLSKLATNEVIEHLARTNEMGMAGIGTSFQVGLSNGLDPVGDTARRILERAENPKAPPVMAEIKGHLLGLEEIQAQYLAQGDLALAAKVQANIDTLHDLIGTTDTTNAVLEYMRSDAASADAVMLGYAGRTASASERTAAKDFNPEVNIHQRFTIPVTVNAASTQTAINTYELASSGHGSAGTPI